MRKSTKIAVGVAFAGLAAAGGAALTGSGLTNGAGSTQFVGGTVSQSVTGATLADVAYTFTDSSNTKVSGISLTFSSTADGTHVAVTPSGGGAGAGTFTCADVASNASACTYTPGTDTLTGYLGLSSLAVTAS